jgi:hypothetical protein
MKRKLLIGLIFSQIIILIALSLFPAGVATASSPSLSYGHGTHCVRHKRIPVFVHEAQLRARGFFINTAGSGSLNFERDSWHRDSAFDVGVDLSDSASVRFRRRPIRRYLSLNVAADPSVGPHDARITEIDTSLPPEQRVLCWQPTARKNVVAEYTIRFDQENTPPELTENILLWNASLGVDRPMTAVGVSRNNIFNGYFAVVAQDLDFNSFPAPGSGYLQLVPMPTWVDPTDWHSVRVTMSQTEASIEVAQGEQHYTTILEATVPQPFEPLGFEFSVDNEVFPGLRVPVTVPDSLDVGYFAIGLRR